jgi:heme-degrading monooxygenase HmoA
MIIVTIERYCQPGNEEQFRDLLIELRAMAMRQPGHISGATLRELFNPSLFKVISTWTSLEAWRTWQESSQRLLIEEKLNSITMHGNKIRIFAVDLEIK